MIKRQPPRTGWQWPLRHRRLFGAALAALTLLGASSADAQTVTVGPPLPGNFHGSASIGGDWTFTDTALSEPGANVTSPVTGTIVFWRVYLAFGTLKLRVLSPNGGTTYTGAGTSAPQNPPTVDLQGFPANLPIRAGQAIGIDAISSPSWQLGDNIISGSTHDARLTPPLADGDMKAFSTGAVEWAFNADVRPNQPSITSISPTSGSVTGRTGVTIRGNGFSGATGVSFGSLPAVSFAVNSDSQITAVSPRSSKLGAVDLGVSVFGVDSASVPADKFTYLGCLVPKLKGKKLKRARRTIRNRDCRLGRVRGPRSGRVKKQQPKAGTVLPGGSKVKIKLG